MRGWDLGGGGVAGEVIDVGVFPFSSFIFGILLGIQTDVVLQLMLEHPEVKRNAYSQWEHKSTPRYASGNLCIVGDAAHATTPWQGAGAGQAFEDAMILGALLAEFDSAEDVGVAFEVYDAVRRPRCQRVIDSSRETGLLFCGRNDEVGLDPERLRTALAEKWVFLHGKDLVEYKAKAVEMMRGGLKKV